jgi:hypothetical protein
MVLSGAFRSCLQAVMLFEGPPIGLEGVLCVPKPYSAAKLKDAVAAALKR